MEAVTSPPVLALPKAELPFSIDTDASTYQVGAALFQTYPDGTRKPHWVLVPMSERRGEELLGFRKRVPRCFLGSGHAPTLSSRETFRGPH